MLCKRREQKQDKVFTHWTCPFCAVVIPDFRRSWISIEMRIKNHLIKKHRDRLNAREVEQMVTQVFNAYHAAGSIGGGDSYGKG